jgi:glycosyltransferase involved in cell wall biosynthesis
MACGKPVVASRLPGVRTLVTDGLNGYLAEPRSPVDLAEKIRLCMQNAAALGAHGRRVAEEHLNWSAVAQRLLGLYEHLTRRPGRTVWMADRTRENLVKGD